MARFFHTSSPMSHRTRQRMFNVLHQAQRLAFRVTLLQEIIVATNAELTAKLDELEQAIKDDEAQDDANEAQLNAVIADLRANQPDIAAIVARLDSIKGNLHAPAQP